MTFEAASSLVLWIVVTVVTLATSALYGRLQALEAGTLASATANAVRYAPPSSQGIVFTDSLVLLLSGRCPTCRDLVGEAARLMNDDKLPVGQVVAVFDTDEAAIPDWPSLRAVAVVPDSALFKRFNPPATPTVALIDSDGAITSFSPVASVERFREAVQSHHFSAIVQANDQRPT